MREDKERCISLVEIRKRRLFWIVLTIVSVFVAVGSLLYARYTNDHIAWVVLGFSVGIIVSSYYLTFMDSVLAKLQNFAPYGAQTLDPKKINADAYEVRFD